MAIVDAGNTGEGPTDVIKELLGNVDWDVEGGEVGRYWIAINEFLASNDADHLEPYVGRGIYDLNGRYWLFETRPNVLRKLDSVGELHFIEIYADVAK